MYAVIMTGGKQYKVIEGQTLKVETLLGEAGSKITLDQVLMVANGEAIKIGTPFLKQSNVSAEILSHGRHKKIKIIKFRRRKHHRKQMGHRQNYTEIKITGIKAG
jgi:large subunit ribosomal protein L21